MALRLSMATPSGTTRSGLATVTPPAAGGHAPQADPVDLARPARAGPWCPASSPAGRGFAGSSGPAWDSAWRAPGAARSNEVIDEADQAEEARKADRAGGDVGVVPLQLPDEDRLDRERRQRDQHGGHVQTHLPAHLVVVPRSSSRRSRPRRPRSRPVRRVGPRTHRRSVARRSPDRESIRSQPIEASPKSPLVAHADSGRGVRSWNMAQLCAALQDPGGLRTALPTCAPQARAIREPAHLSERSTGSSSATSRTRIQRDFTDIFMMRV